MRVVGEDGRLGVAAAGTEAPRELIGRFGFRLGGQAEDFGAGKLERSAAKTASDSAASGASRSAGRRGRRTCPKSPDGAAFEGQGAAQDAYSLRDIPLGLAEQPRRKVGPSGAEAERGRLDNKDSRRRRPISMRTAGSSPAAAAFSRAAAAASASSGRENRQRSQPASAPRTAGLPGSSPGPMSSPITMPRKPALPEPSFDDAGARGGRDAIALESGHEHPADETAAAPSRDDSGEGTHLAALEPFDRQRDEGHALVAVAANRRRGRESGRRMPLRPRAKARASRQRRGGRRGGYPLRSPRGRRPDPWDRSRGRVGGARTISTPQAARREPSR